jgi:hypothetical protein
MTRELKLEQLYTVLDDAEYPVSREAALDRYDDVTLVLADGTVPLTDVLADAEAEEFVSADDLCLDVMNLLPRHAVGEPFQSEGDAD